MSQEGFDALKRESINAGLCVECGACALVCPTKAISLKQYAWGRNPELVGACSEDACTRCLDVCPAREVPIAAIEQQYFGRCADPTTFEQYLGVFRQVYTGHALDTEVHEQAVSGGMISALLIHALETGQIDGAVLASFDPEQPWMAKAYVATTREEILQCAGSKYQPHPQLLGLEDARQRDLRKLAITSTPCQAVAVRKLMMDEQFADFGSRIKLVFSNVCAAHWSVHGTEWLITEQMGLKLEDVAGIKYRARPFPGNFQVRLKDGSVHDAPFVNSYLGMLGRFTPEECRVCLEKVGYAGDIIVGDTWHHPKLCPSLLGTYSEADMQADERIGKAQRGLTAVVARSAVGEQLLESAAAAGAVKLYPEDHETAEAFLRAVHVLGKPVANGPVIAARERRGMPVRRYLR